MPNVKIGETLSTCNTISTKAARSCTWLIRNLLTIYVGADAASRVVPTVIPIEQLPKTTYPRTVEKYVSLCEEIREVHRSTVDPENWAISVNSETNTKFPHRDTLKIVAISFAWVQVSQQPFHYGIRKHPTIQL